MGGKIFRTHADRPWGPPSLLLMSIGFLPGVKHPWHGVNHPPLLSAEAELRIELYLYSLSVPSWQDVGRTLSLALFNDVCNWDYIASDYSTTSEQWIGKDLEGCVDIPIWNTVKAFAWKVSASCRHWLDIIIIRSAEWSLFDSPLTPNKWQG
jgi:hypothetical protein